MGQITGTCGHIVDPEFFKTNKSTYGVKEHSREGKRVVSIITTCESCRKWYSQHRQILKPDNYKKWMKGH